MNIKYTPLLLVLILAGCAVQPPSRGSLGSFSVKIVPYFGKDVRVYARAFERVNGQRGPVLASQRVTGDGVTAFVLPLGKTYAVSAFADLDGNGKQGPDDPAANLEDLRPEGNLDTPLVPVVLTLPGVGEAPDWPRKRSSGLPLGISQDDVQKGLDTLREVAPQLPIPPVPPPPPQ